MAERNWDLEYEHFLQTALEKGEIEEADYSYKRSAPRFQLKAGAVEVTLKQRFTGIDASIGGISFFSNFPIQPGISIELGTNNMESVEAEVTLCSLVEPNSDNSKMNYRVHCKLANMGYGKRFLIMIKEADNLGMALI